MGTKTTKPDLELRIEKLCQKNTKNTLSKTS